MNSAALPRSRKDIRALTRKLRKLLGLENKPYFPVLEVIENIFGDPEVFGLEIEVMSLAEMPTEYALTYPNQNRMKIREDVYYGALAGNPRDRFTLCHEIGHYLLHDSKDIAYARGSIPAYMDPEWQANCFAAELMAPAHLIREMSVQEISEKCGMSFQAAEIQFNTLHKSV